MFTQTQKLPFPWFKKHKQDLLSLTLQVSIIHTANWFQISASKIVQQPKTFSRRSVETHLKFNQAKLYLSKYNIIMFLVKQNIEKMRYASYTLGLLFDHVRIQADTSLWRISNLGDTSYIKCKPVERDSWERRQSNLDHEQRQIHENSTPNPAPMWTAC